jgi:tRNA (guanine26-N2/guanine27-N2)-dimethyltransferase
MLIGAAWREAASRGLRVQPLFSLYSSHGPVFRAMLRVTRSKGERLHNYGFLGYSHVNGSTREINFK